jgi:hypothetical protein
MRTIAILLIVLFLVGGTVNASPATGNGNGKADAPGQQGINVYPNPPSTSPGHTGGNYGGGSSDAPGQNKGPVSP